MKVRNSFYLLVDLPPLGSRFIADSLVQPPTVINFSTFQWVNTTASKMTVKTVQETTKVHRPTVIEIQGLRGVAITSVLLFHLWDKTFEVGYLGVDIFFVISGYLMCMLLNAKAPLSLANIVDFYFRRIKRIIPTYLFVIYCCLFAAIFLISSTDYRDLVSEAKKPLLYISNWPDTPEDDYFDETAEGYFYFLHLWSLSVELQFYLFIPFVVLALHRLSTVVHLPIILALSFASFYFQSTASKDSEHMSLVGRIWQFMFGFLAWYLQQQMQKQLEVKNIETEKLISDDLESEETSHNEFADSKTNSVVKGIISGLQFCLPFVLLFLLWRPTTSIRQLNRFLVILAATLNIGLSADAGIWSNRLLVWIGNISYSVYLVHWPLFEWRRYEFVENENDVKSLTWTMGFFLIAISIAIGYLIEEMFKSLSKWLSNWFRLLAVVCVLYLANGVTLWYLKSNEIGFSINATQRENGPEMEIRMKAIEFFENRKKPIETDPSHLLKYSRDFSEAALHFWYCNKSIGWQSNYKEFSKMGHLANNSCTVTDGNGTKTIVVFGNSHARTYMPGIMHAFRDVYSNITLLFRNGCYILDAAPYQADAKRCTNERASYLKILEQWKYPIDILIIGLTYGAPDTEPYDQIENDPIYRNLEKDLAALSAVARDVVMLPNVQLMTGIDSYISKWRNKISNKESLDGFNLPIEASLKNRPRSREHLSKVNCSKCAKMNWEDLWCNRTTGMCNSIDPVSHLNYFYDQHHPTYFGSMFVGQFFRKRYDQWLNEHSNLTDYFKSDVVNTTTILKTLK
ncbi:hypothetical protein M3Y96_00561300 [Aphelenchoides besseyi]|nr:hypothetical protein M3Y96_00561300 [Aphelenchoides besseyi]